MKTKMLVLTAAMLILTIGSRALAQSASELLEKAIYTEETVGDLDEAIKIYEQVVAKGKATRGYAAQAQYRLAMCYLKMGKKEQATAALKKVVEEFADQKELVAKAKQQLPEAAGPKLDPVPWADGEQLRLTAKLATGLEIGAFTLSARTDEADGRKVWRMQVGRYISLNAPNLGVSRVVADRETFRPIHSLFRHSILGTIDVDYTKTQAKVRRQGIDGKQTTQDIDLDGVYYDNEQGMFLFRRLPLEVGYKVDVPICAPIGSGPIEIGLEVTGKETVKVPAGEFECYKVYLPLVQQTFWYGADEHRYLVKFEAGGVSVELASVRTNKPGEMVGYHDDRFGFSITAPTEWYFLKQELPNEDAKRVTYFLADPEAAAMSALVVQPLEELKDDQKASPRAWADFDIRDAEKAYTDYKVRPDSWKQRDLSGQPAVSFVADYEKGGRQMVEYCVYSQGDSNAVVFCSKMEKDWFDKLHDQLDSIVDTYQAN